MLLCYRQSPRPCRMLFMFVVCLLSATTHAEVPAAWPEFRGPQGNGHATNLRESTELPSVWSESNNIRWKREIDGEGWSSPVIADGQIWVTTASEDGRKMSGICLDFATGQTLWERVVIENESPREKHKTNSYASPSPLIIGDKVILHFGSYGTICLNRESFAEIWRREDLQCNHWRGPGSSPMHFEQQIFIHFDGYDLQYVVALDPETGRTIWKSDRDIDYQTDDGDIKKAYATPTVIHVDGQPQLISPSSKATIAYDPYDGSEIWRIRYPGFSATARPVFGDGLIFVNSGFSKAEMFAVRTGGLGDITDSHVAWQERKSIGSKPSFTLLDGRLYILHDAGVLSCLDAQTGQTIWVERLGGNFSASPIYADGHIYIAEESGKAVVIKPGDTFQLVAENQLNEGCMASPAAYDDSLVWRTRTAIYRLTKMTP